MTVRRITSMKQQSFWLVAGIGMAVLLQGCGPGDAPAGFFNFRLETGTEVHLELTGIESPPETTASLRIRDQVLFEPGDSALLGVAVDDLHIHGDYTVTAPGGVELEELNFSVAFKLTDPSARYGDSIEYRASLHPAHEHHEDDGHDHQDGEGDDTDGEIDALVGSTALGAGDLTLQFDFEGPEAEPAIPVDLFPAACLGGTGEECEGGTLLFSGSGPGFAPK